MLKRLSLLRHHGTPMMAHLQLPKRELAKAVADFDYEKWASFWVVFVCMYVCMYVCIYIHILIVVYDIHVYIYIYIHTYIYSQ